jgi:glucosyl-dolichyl phosphate glucuronosyltransferase
MTISVVIATFNRAALLEECLTFLARQPFQPGDEIIVVDNGSTDRTQQVLRAAAARLAVPVRTLVEPTPGKSHALARAIETATGDVLAFTDDDVDVEEGWLPAIRRRMSDQEIALMGGPVVARWEQEPPAWLRDVSDGSSRIAAPLALVNYGPTLIPLGARTLLGANMAVRRSVFARLGGFQPSLGKLRGTLLSGEDHEFCQRVQAAGLRAVYDPAASVRHWVPKSRMRVGYYASWFYWSGITHALLDTGGDRRAIGGVPVYLLRRAAASLPKAAAAAAVGRMRDSIESLIDVAFVTGYLKTRWVPAPSRPVLRATGGSA